MAAAGKRRALRRLALAVGLVTAAGFLPPIQARGKALGVLAEAVGIGFPRPFAATISRSDLTLDGVTGHLYAPTDPAPPVLLLPGAAPLGKEDPRAIRLARSLARAGRAVFIPDLILYERRLEPGDIERIVRAAAAFPAHAVAEGPVVLLGISYGGSFALIASADDRLRGRVAQVATFGSYWDLLGVIQAVTTGTSLVGEARVPWEGHPMARSILEEAVVRLLPEPARPPLRAALASDDPGGLPGEARAVFDLLRTTEPGRTRELAEQLPADLRTLLERFSPSSVEGRIAAPVVAMHSTDDPAVPYGELIRLRRALPEARIMTVSSFRHVDPTTPSSGGWATTFADAWDAWTFTSWILAAQE